MTITKTATPAIYSNVGDVIHYTYTVTNTENVSLTGLVVTDTEADNPPGVSALTSTSLSPSGSAKATAQHTITLADISAGSVTNTGIVTCTQGVTAQDTKTVTAINLNPALTIKKVADPIIFTEKGQTVTYTYTVTNSGNVDIKAPINIVDDKFGTITLQSSGILSPGSSITRTVNYQITDADMDSCSVTNLVYATVHSTVRQLLQTMLLGYFSVSIESVMKNIKTLKEILDLTVTLVLYHR